MFTTMTMYTTVDVHNDDHDMVIVVNVYCCIHGHRSERLLLYHMVIVVTVYCCIYGHRCERLLLYIWSSL
jgi:hypothetical protein